MSKKILILILAGLVLLYGWEVHERSRIRNWAVVSAGAQSSYEQKSAMPVETPLSVAEIIASASSSVPMAKPVPSVSPLLNTPAPGSAVADGKMALPPSKEVVEPVGELVGSPSNAIFSRPGDPPGEYLNKPDNRLLSPPNPQNTGGPVVSNETK